MAHQGAELARTLFSRLIDSGVQDAHEQMDVTAEQRLDEVRALLAERFRLRPTLSGILLRVDGQGIGVATRRLVLAEPGTAGEQPPLGVADHASLPGVSQQFIAVRFVCSAPGCGSTVLRSFYDERAIPVCGIAAHGALVVQR